MHNNRRVFVTGMGMVSPIGMNCQENAEALFSGKHGISDIEYIQTLHRNKLLVGEIKKDKKALAELLGLESTYGINRTALLSALAAQEAYNDGGCIHEPSLKSACISATSVSGMTEFEDLYKDALGLANKTEFLDTYEVGDHTEKIALQLGFTDIIDTVITACSSSANAIIMAARLIQHGYVDRALAGGVDSLTTFTINGFNSMVIYTQGICKPFDQNRSGLNLGEGAAYLILESEEVLHRSNKKIYAELTGFANGNDAYHPSALSDDGRGPAQVMSEALHMAQLKPEQIDYINAHGTGTENNDNAEAIAMKKVFGHIPAFNSGKSYTGHTLGAAAAMGAVQALLCMDRGFLFPSLHIENPMEILKDNPPIQKSEKKLINHVMSNSFGFGGNCVSLIFSKYQ